MDSALTFFLLAFSSTVNAAMNGTSCYKCMYDSTMPKNKRFCNATLQECKPKETYCGSFSLKSESINGTIISMFGKNCYGSVDCDNTTKTCEGVIQNEGYLACSLVCCKGSGCNSAAVAVSPIVSKMFIFGLIAVINFT